LFCKEKEKKGLLKKTQGVNVFKQSEKHFFSLPREKKLQIDEIGNFLGQLRHRYIVKTIVDSVARFWAIVYFLHFFWKLPK
jgi:hypothetical protein